MPTKRSIKRRLNDLEANLTHDGPFLFVPLFDTRVAEIDQYEGTYGEGKSSRQSHNPDLYLAVKEYMRANHNPWDSGIVIITVSEFEETEARLSAALDRLAERTGVRVSLKQFLAYLNGRRSGEIPPGEVGVSEHFDGLTTENVNWVWREFLFGKDEDDEER